MYLANKQIFYVDSAQRILSPTSTTSNFSYKFNIDPNTSFDKVVVLDLSIPTSYYLVQSSQNTFILEELGVQVVITVPVGNYSRSAFGSTISTLLNSNSPNAWTYSILKSNSITGPETGKFHFTVSGNSSQPSFIFGTCLYEQFGLNANSTSTFSAGVLDSTNVVSFSKETTLYLHSDICQSNSDNILQQVYSSGEIDYSFIHFANTNPYEYSKPLNTSSDTFTFYLTDESDNLIDLNGINMNITILMYKESIINNLLQKYISLKVL